MKILTRVHAGRLADLATDRDHWKTEALRLSATVQEQAVQIRELHYGAYLTETAKAQETLRELAEVVARLREGTQDEVQDPQEAPARHQRPAGGTPSAWLARRPGESSTQHP